MALGNYTDLLAAVANELHRSDLTDVIPDKVALAEVRINGDLDARLQDKKSTLTCVAGTSSVVAPTDVVNIRHLSVAVTPIVTLTYVSPDTFESSYPYEDSGVPKVFSVIGDSIYLAPTPDYDYTLDIVYKGLVPSLESNGTTWLMTRYPNVYLYATLCEMAPYIKDDARMAMWEAKYNNAIDSVNSQDWYSGSTMRVRTDVR
jgi:hypothetical protein